MTLKRTRAPGGQHRRAAGKARSALPNITLPAAAARLRHPRRVRTESSKTLFKVLRAIRAAPREGEHRRKKPPLRPRGRGNGQPLSRGETQAARRPFSGERYSGTSGAQPGGRPPAAAMPGKAPQGRGALAKVGPPRPAPPARPPRRGRRAAPGPAAAPPQGREAWRSALQCPPPPAPHSHQLPPVRPSSSFFSEFQMNFFQFPSPSLAFPRAMVSGRGAAGENERRIGGAPAGTPRPGLEEAWVLPPALRGGRRRWPGGGRYRELRRRRAKEKRAEPTGHRAAALPARRAPSYTPPAPAPPAARPMGAGGGARGRGTRRAGRCQAGGVGLVRGSCGARARAGGRARRCGAASG